MNRRYSKPEIGVLYGFRVLMILFVANFHIYQQSWMRQTVELFSLKWDFTTFTSSGYLFVDGMILLSGFLLYLPYALEEGYQIGAGHFYLKRFARIVPSYEAAILLSFLLVALPRGAYLTAQAGAKDVLAHVCFLQMFSKETYLYSPLNGAVWTIVVEMQFYLLFPLLASWARKKPLPTLLGMAAIGWGYRFCVGRFCEDTSALVNQLPAYMDVFALGMAGAMLYGSLKKLLEGWKGTKRLLGELAGLALFAFSCVCLWQLTIRQAHAAWEGYPALRISQMTLEFPFSLAILAAMLGAAFAPPLFQKLLDNRLMRFLSAISMNFYVWHQLIAVQLRLRWFPDADALHASYDSQSLYTLLCYLAAFVVAMLMTYAIEKPAARLLNAAAKRLPWGGHSNFT